MANIHFRTAVSTMRRSPFQALAAIFVLTVTFFVLTILSTLVYSSENVIRYFETRPQVILFLKDEAKPSEVTNLQDNLKMDSKIKDVNYVSKENALDIYKQATQDNPLLSELVNPSIFPASLEFTLTDLNYANEMIENLKGNSVVDQVGFTASLGSEQSLGDTINRLKTITSYLRLGGGIFVGLLIFTSFMVLLVLISLRLVTRKQEIEILDLIGATPAFIRSPIVIEAIIYSLVGVFLGWILGFILVLYSTPQIISYFSQIRVLPTKISELLSLFGIILAGEIIIGLMLSIGGSVVAVKRSRKKIS